jgi:leucyl/phenylalanyl-tRNA--protein transferase
MRLPILDTQRPEFPDPSVTLDDPDGLLAIGGNLFPTTLLSAYYRGIFPWYSEGDPILWWSPSIRCVLIPSELHLSKSLRKQLRKEQYRVTLNCAFDAVINSCSQRAPDQGTWINQDMILAYSALHKLGHAHSLELWDGDNLIGGVYGVCVGSIFCGESMFSRQSNASKIALAYLCNYLINIGIKIIDCQLVNDHLLSLGAKSISRDVFLNKLEILRDHKVQWSAEKIMDFKIP